MKNNILMYLLLVVIIALQLVILNEITATQEWLGEAAGYISRRFDSLTSTVKTFIWELEQAQ